MTTEPEGPTDMTSSKLWSDMTSEVFELNTAKGWYAAEANRTFRESKALIQSEIAEVTENYRSHRLDPFTNALGKPDDVPSELADVGIRLLDLCHRQGWNLDNLLADLDRPMGDRDDHPPFSRTVPDDVVTFIDHVDWLHDRTATLAADRPDRAVDVLLTLTTICRIFNVNLIAEYARKMAFNWTRPPLHGGRTLRDDR